MHPNFAHGYTILHQYSIGYTPIRSLTRLVGFRVGTFQFHTFPLRDSDFFVYFPSSRQRFSLYTFLVATALFFSMFFVFAKHFFLHFSRSRQRFFPYFSSPLQRFLHIFSSSRQRFCNIFPRVAFKKLFFPIATALS